MQLHWEAVLTTSGRLPGEWSVLGLGSGSPPAGARSLLWYYPVGKVCRLGGGGGLSSSSKAMVTAEATYSKRLRKSLPLSAVGSWKRHAALETSEYPPNPCLQASAQSIREGWRRVRRLRLIPCLASRWKSSHCWSLSRCRSSRHIGLRLFRVCC